MSIIEVNNVVKEYKLGQLKSFKHAVCNGFERLRGRTVEKPKPFRALDGVSFQVKPGEVIGIIGQNGAGKSTLLKILASISRPTRGTVSVDGAVAPLIEVGAGLVGDLSGRENIFLNGAILGLSRSEIKSKFDEIVAFAELEEFIDTPIKRYSSGMAVRLGFAIASSVDSDILIVDEVLAVGDLAFQRKCFEKMEDIIRGRGKTVLLVSHNIRQVERICSRVILLEHGKIIADGAVTDVCEMFYKKSNDKIQAQAQLAANAKISTSGEVTIDSIDILDDFGDPVSEIESGAKLRVRVRFTLLHDLENIEIVTGTHRTDFVYISAATTRSVLPDKIYKQGRHEVEYIVNSFPLVAGTYSVRLAFLDKNFRFLFNGESLKSFAVRAKQREPMNSQWKTVNLSTQLSVDGESYILPP